jgi:ABC-2 type transport system permease protein
MKYLRIRAMFLKEFRHILRDKRSLAIALAIPVLMLLLYGFALSLDVDRIPTLIYDQDGSANSLALAHQFQGSRYFDIRGFAADYGAIEEGINRGDILIGLVIPKDFGRDLRSGRETTAQILVDGSDSNTAAIAMGYAESVVQSYSAAVGRETVARRTGRKPPPAVEPQTRVWYNSSLESRNYVVPGLIAVILMILVAQLTSLTVAREWDLGTMEQILSTPLRPIEIVLGKMLAYFVVGLADSAIAVTVGILVFKVPFRGNPLVLVVSTVVFLVGVLFWGIFISAATRTQVMAFQMGILSSFLPGFLLSGFVFAIDTMPTGVQVVSFLVPARYFITILKGVFLKGIGFEILWWELAFLLIYSIVIFRLTVRKMNLKVA